MSEDVEEYTFLLTRKEALYLNAAVIDFFHKIKSAKETETLLPTFDEDYRTIKTLWNKVEEKVGLSEWK